MFQRVFVEDWQRILSAIGIFLFFLVFVAIVIRTWRMPHSKVRHLESLPLDDDRKSTSHDEPR